jgi:plasmid stabilization system protein ParE
MFTVRWKRIARDRLAELWMQASDRSAVTAAANRIDVLLQFDPDNQGESRDRGRRLLVEPPLGVIFRVNHQKRIVYVLRVWRTSPNP